MIRYWVFRNIILIYKDIMLIVCFRYLKRNFRTTTDFLRVVLDVLWISIVHEQAVIYLLSLCIYSLCFFKGQALRGICSVPAICRVMVSGIISELEGMLIGFINNLIILS